MDNNIKNLNVTDVINIIILLHGNLMKEKVYLCVKNVGE